MVYALGRRPLYTRAQTTRREPDKNEKKSRIMGGGTSNANTAVAQVPAAVTAAVSAMISPVPGLPDGLRWEVSQWTLEKKKIGRYVDERN